MTFKKLCQISSAPQRQGEPCNKLFDFAQNDNVAS